MIPFCVCVRALGISITTAMAAAAAAAVVGGVCRDYRSTGTLVHDTHEIRMDGWMEK